MYGGSADVTGGSGIVIINTDLLQLTRSAYAQYKMHLNDVKRAEEIARSARKAKEE